jgi:hypothetical protein
LSGIARNLINGALAFRGAGVSRWQSDITATLIYDYNLILGVLGYLGAVGRSSFLVPLGGSQRLFSVSSLSDESRA